MLDRTLARIPLLLALTGSAAGCVGAEQVRIDMEAHVEESNTCAADTDCTLIYTSCPAGCFHAVRVELAEECEAYADRLVASYEAGGARCDYDCVAPGEPYCDTTGRCRVDPAE